MSPRRASKPKCLRGIQHRPRQVPSSGNRSDRAVGQTPVWRWQRGRACRGRCVTGQRGKRRGRGADLARELRPHVGPGLLHAPVRVEPVPLAVAVEEHAGCHEGIPPARTASAFAGSDTISAMAERRVSYPRREMQREPVQALRRAPGGGGRRGLEHREARSGRARQRRRSAGTGRDGWDRGTRGRQPPPGGHSTRTSAPAGGSPAMFSTVRGRSLLALQPPIPAGRSCRRDARARSPAGRATSRDGCQRRRLQEDRRAARPMQTTSSSDGAKAASRREAARRRRGRAGEEHKDVRT